MNNALSSLDDINKPVLGNCFPYFLNEMYFKMLENAMFKQVKTNEL